MAKHYIFTAPAWAPDWVIKACNQAWKRFFPGKVRYYVTGD